MTWVVHDEHVSSLCMTVGLLFKIISFAKIILRNPSEILGKVLMKTLMNAKSTSYASKTIKFLHVGHYVRNCLIKKLTHNFLRVCSLGFFDLKYDIDLESTCKEREGAILG